MACRGGYCELAEKVVAARGTPLAAADAANDLVRRLITHCTQAVRQNHPDCLEILSRADILAVLDEPTGPGPETKEAAQSVVAIAKAACVLRRSDERRMPEERREAVTEDIVNHLLEADTSRYRAHRAKPIGPDRWEEVKLQLEAWGPSERPMAIRVAEALGGGLGLLLATLSGQPWVAKAHVEASVPLLVGDGEAELAQLRLEARPGTGRIDRHPDMMLVPISEGFVSAVTEGIKAVEGPKDIDVVWAVYTPSACPLQGGSVGAAAGVATLALAYTLRNNKDAPLSPEWSFTGAVDMSGRLISLAPGRRVEDVEHYVAKLEVAAKANKRLVVPAEDRALLTNDHRFTELRHRLGDRLCYAPTIYQAWEYVFERGLRPAEPPPGVSKKVLASLVGVVIAVAVGASLLTMALLSKEKSSRYDTVATPTFAPGTTMDTIQKRGKIIVGIKFDQPGFGFREAASDEVKGFDAEIAKLIAASIFGGNPDDMNSKIDFVEAVTKDREPFIENGRVHIIVATYTINEARRQRVDFAGPYFIAKQDIMVRAGNNSIKSVDDLNGKEVCTVAGSTSEKNLREKAPNAKVRATTKYSQCAVDLDHELVDAITTDDLVLLGLMKENPGAFKLVNEPFSEEPYGIGLKKGDDTFRMFLNDRLTKIRKGVGKDSDWQIAYARTIGEIGKPEPPQVDRS